jgi:hypothetical protein
MTGSFNAAAMNLPSAAANEVNAGAFAFFAEPGWVAEHVRAISCRSSASWRWALDKKKRPTPAMVGRSCVYYAARQEGFRRCGEVFG